MADIPADVLKEEKSRSPLVKAVRRACVAQRASSIQKGRLDVAWLVFSERATLTEVGQAIFDLDPLNDEWVFERAVELWESLEQPERARELLAARAADALP